MKAKIQDREYDVTDHAILRYSMRINSETTLDNTVIEQGKLVSLANGYDRGIWNKEIGAVFLIGGKNTVATTITDQKIGLKEETLEKCSCGFHVQPEHQKYICRNCENRIIETKPSQKIVNENS